MWWSGLGFDGLARRQTNIARFGNPMMVVYSLPYPRDFESRRHETNVDGDDPLMWDDFFFLLFACSPHFPSIFYLVLPQHASRR